MVAIALVGCLLGLLNEGILSFARSGHARFHRDRARWFAIQADAYGGSRSGIREACSRLAAWHTMRADEYGRSRKYDHEVEMKQDFRQTERENPIDRLLVIDRDARRARGAAPSKASR